MSIISVILGAFSIISSLICLWNQWYISAIIGVSGLMFGFVGIKVHQKYAVSRAGIILSVIGISLTLLFIISYNIICRFFLQMNI